MRNSTSLFVLVILAAAMCGCEETIEHRSGVSTEPPSITYNLLAPLPDWSDHQYDWLIGRDSLCKPFGRENWYPKFDVRAKGASPDGRRVLIASKGRTAIYDVQTGALTTVYPGLFEYVEWSHDGKHIAGQRPSGGPNDFYVIMDAEAGTYRYVPFPSFADPSILNPGIRWTPGDTSVLINFNSKDTNAYPTGTYAVNIYSGSVQKWALNRLAYSFSGDTTFILRVNASKVYLDIGRISDPTYAERHTITGPVDIERNALPALSPNGRRLAFGMRLYYGDTRFATPSGGWYDQLPAVGIIDLTPGTSTQNQLYRSFIDPLYSWRYCNNTWLYDIGAWGADSRSYYYGRIRRSDSSMQLVKLDTETGEETELSNFLTAP